MSLTRGGVLQVVGGVKPGSDNAVDLGAASLRWKDVYASNGTMQTSDARAKTPFQPVPERVKRAVRTIVA